MRGRGSLSLCELLATLQSGKDLANQTGVPKQQYDVLTARFNQLSAALLPLSQETVVLDQSRSNLLEWKRSLSNESAAMLRSLFFRELGIAVALGVIVGLSEAWRRLTLRYVHDPRRRRQFLLLRRFVMGFLIGIGWTLRNSRGRSNHRGRSNRRCDTRPGAPVHHGTRGYGSGLVLNWENCGVFEFRAVSSAAAVVQTMAGYAIHVARSGFAARHKC
jgi:hypothetical protein